MTERGQLDGKTDPRKAKISEDEYPPFYQKLNSLEDRFEYKVTQKALAFLEENKVHPGA